MTRGYPALSINFCGSEGMLSRLTLYNIMPHLNEGQPEPQKGNIRKMQKSYQDSDRPPIRPTGTQYQITCSTFRGGIAGVQEWARGHRAMQVLTQYQEKSMVPWCKKLDAWWHPPPLVVVKSIAQALLWRRVNTHIFGKY